MSSSRAGRCGCTHGSQVDDHGDVLVAAAGVAPDVLIDTDHRDALEPVRILDQDPLPSARTASFAVFHATPLPSATRAMLRVRQHDPPGPSAGRRGSIGPRFGCGAGVLAPHVPAVAAPAHGQPQRWGATRTGSCASSRVIVIARDAPTAAPTAPSSGSTTRQASTARPGSRCWPVTSRPSPSKRVKVVRSGA